MVVPVRFDSGYVGIDAPEESGYKVTYTSPHSPGETFILHTMLDAEADEQRVVLKEGGFADGYGSVDFATSESVNRYGARTTGFRVPEFGGSLEVVVRRGPDGTVMDTLRDWRRAWSHFEDGRLKVVARDGGNREARVRLVGFGEVPFDPAGVTLFEDSVQYRCLEGFWRGPTFTRTGAFSVSVPGDLPPMLQVRWDGVTETSFTLPSGLRVNLSTRTRTSATDSRIANIIASFPGLAGSLETADDSTVVDPVPIGTRYINLDRGMQGQVTDENGDVDTRVWSALRGVLVGETLTPHRTYEFELGDGLELLVTPRYLHPWR